MRTKQITEIENYRGITLEIIHYEAKGRTYGTWLCTAYLYLYNKNSIMRNINGKIISVTKSTRRGTVEWCKKQIDEMFSKRDFVFTFSDLYSFIYNKIEKDIVLELYKNGEYETIFLRFLPNPPALYELYPVINVEYDNKTIKVYI